MRRGEEENERQEEHAASVVSYGDTRISLSLSIDGSTTAFRPLNWRGPCDRSDPGFGRSTLYLSLSINLQHPSDLWTDQALFRWIWSGPRKKAMMLLTLSRIWQSQGRLQNSPPLSLILSSCVCFFSSLLLVLLLENRHTEECGVVYLIQTLCISIVEFCLSESCPMMMMNKKVILPPLPFWRDFIIMLMKESHGWCWFWEEEFRVFGGNLQQACVCVQCSMKKGSLNGIVLQNNWLQEATLKVLFASLTILSYVWCIS